MPRHEQLLPLKHTNPEHLAHLLVGGEPPEILAQLGTYLFAALHQLCPTAGDAQGAGSIAKVVLNLAANVGNGKGAEGDTPSEIKALDGLDQTNATDLEQVIEIFLGLLAPVVGFFANQTEV